MKVYPIMHWPECEIDSSIVCLCQTEADAQEMVLSFKENQPYDEYLDYIHEYPNIDVPIEEFLYDPLKVIYDSYYIDYPVEVLP